MTDKEISDDERITEILDTDEHTTEPHANAPDKWEMPEPVFQQTSGYLPQGYVKKIEEEVAAADVQPENTEDTETAPSDAPPPATEAAADVEQYSATAPDPLSVEELATSPAIVVKPPSTVRPIAILIALLVVALFVAVVLAVVFFGFLARPDEINNF